MWNILKVYDKINLTSNKLKCFFFFLFGQQLKTFISKHAEKQLKESAIWSLMTSHFFFSIGSLARTLLERCMGDTFSNMLEALASETPGQWWNRAENRTPGFVSGSWVCWFLDRSFPGVEVPLTIFLAKSG